MEGLLADRPTPLADEGLVPLSVLRLVTRMIVPPDKKQEQSEDRTRNQGEERQGSRRHGRRIRCDGIDVKDQPTGTDKHQNRPSGDLEIRPFHRWGQLLGKSRLLSSMRGCSADNYVRTAAANHDSTQPRPAFVSEEPFLVSL